ncbi:MAG: DNA polymerase II large subunit [Cenarchaeum symbiont of Oopsacas minuta]|nr:DNA polymerase II large subunit [Cenarchaeum symbiont of Oopsacas minuta]
MNTAIEHIRSMDIPDYYAEYYSDLTVKTDKVYEHIAKAKSVLTDVTSSIEPKIAYDLADRVAKMHEIEEIATPIRLLLKNNGKEFAAMTFAKDLALGKYQPKDTTLKDRLDLAVRVGLAIVTEGVTIAPLQGISDVQIRKNKDGTEYLSVSIAGPMRSAGGTESAVTILIADHVRKTVGLGTYQANSFGDDETGRFVEELRTYEREASNFQFHVLDEDIVTVISNLPVEIDGPSTDPFDVVNHKGMTRIKTDQVRGGTLRVINDGLIGRSKKLLKRIEKYNMDGWEWLKDLKGVVQSGDDEDASSKRMDEVIVGRSVLSTQNGSGGFRLRYGRACNTGFTSMGFHPAIPEILDHTITVGTQIKTDIPGKGAVVAMVDSIETPIVLLKNGDVIKIRDAIHGRDVRNQIAKILYLGDVLVSFGDFLENNAQMMPTGYVEEYWVEEMRLKDKDLALKYVKIPPTLDHALIMCSKLGMALHPKYLHYWDQLDKNGLQSLLSPVEYDPQKIVLEHKAKAALEKIGIPHTISKSHIMLKGDEAHILYHLLYKHPISISEKYDVLETISKTSGITVRPKYSVSVGIRIGRPEKAAPRDMKPPVHCLFPVNKTGGPTRDITKAAKREDFYANISDRICASCGKISLTIKCNGCGKKTSISYKCKQCKKLADEPFCNDCEKPIYAYSNKKFPLKEFLIKAQSTVNIRAKSPLKGVVDLISQYKIAEPLEKGLIRQNYGLTVFRDGTIRFDATNTPLTHFRPEWINTSVEELRDLGYTKDYKGNDLISDNQTIEIRMQDVVIPIDCAKHLINVSKYVDMELEKIYGNPCFYNISNLKDLLGHLVIGLAPHTSVGILARVIGFTDTQTCFGTPNWHSAKRRDADGDADSIMLYADALLNFSKNFLSDRIGGLMDAPLLIQPLVLPNESQPQAHNLEVVKNFPIEFYKITKSMPKATDVKSVVTVKDRLGKREMYSGYDFTHETSLLASSNPHSAYVTLTSVHAKLDLQIKNAEIINAVDQAKTVSNIVSTHLVPDIMGNLRSYNKQIFRCTSCDKKYRRPPLSKKCVCGNVPIGTITRAGVEKYLGFAIRLVDKYDVGSYQYGRIHALADEIKLVFGESTGDQSLLSDFAN